jgi:hypothetical protein
MWNNSLAYQRANYGKYWGKPDQIKKRTEQNKARKMAWLKKGDPREANHKKPLEHGWTTTKSNIEVISRKKNRQMWAAIANKKKAKKKKQ